MSVSFVAVGYDGEFFQGSQRLFAIGSFGRYNPTTEEQLAALSFDKKMQSLWLYRSDVGTSNVIVFSNDFWGSNPVGDFAGSYLQLSAGKDASGARTILKDFALENLISSVLLVNTERAPELRLSFRDQFLGTWNSTLDALMGSSASRKGDPVMTWAPFPEGMQFLDPNQIYLRITQPLNINLDYWPDYDASITYYLFLFPDGSGQMRGFCQRWDTWVEGGVKSGHISDKLSAQATSGADVINDKLNAAFAGLPTVKDFYYLPGRQVTPVESLQTGSTWDDVTLVFEL